jgi:hypothetical protein
MCQRFGGVVGVEAGLVPFVSKPLGQVEPRHLPVVVPQVRIHVEMVEVVPALEVLMVENCLGHLGADVGAEDLGGNPGVIGDRDRLADVVTQRGHHDLVVGPGPLGPGGRLQTMGQLVDGEAIHHLG